MHMVFKKKYINDFKMEIQFHRLLNRFNELISFSLARMKLMHIVVPHTSDQFFFNEPNRYVSDY